VQLITQRIITKYCCLNNEWLDYVRYVCTAFCVYDVLCNCFCFFKSLCHTVAHLLCLGLQWNSVDWGAWTAPLALSLCSCCMLCAVYMHTVKCKWSVDTILKYIRICVQGYVFFNPLTRLFIVTACCALKYVVTFLLILSVMVCLEGHARFLLVLKM
jgi:hypothetical protein